MSILPCLFADYMPHTHCAMLASHTFTCGTHTHTHTFLISQGRRVGTEEAGKEEAFTHAHALHRNVHTTRRIPRTVCSTPRGLDYLPPPGAAGSVSHDAAYGHSYPPSPSHRGTATSPRLVYISGGCLLSSHLHPRGYTA